MTAFFFDIMIKFLVIRFSSIGDIVLTTPVLRLISNQIEGASVHYLTKNENGSILEHNPYISKIHLLNKDNFTDILDELYNERFDYIIDLHNNIRSLRIKKHLKIVSFTFNKLNVEKWLLVNFKYNKMPNIHIVDRYIETLKVFDVENDNNGLDYFIGDNNKLDISNYFNNHKKTISIILGAKHFTKQIPLNVISDLCTNIDFNIIFLGGKDDVEKSNVILKETTNSNIVNLVGEVNISQSASIISQSDLVITSDTGLMHIASAFRRDIISIWGNTVPEFGMTPYLPGNNSVIVENNDLNCRPCSKIGYSKCPKKHFKCMNNIDVRNLISIIYRILN